jgi:putative transcriptional regulator
MRESRIEVTEQNFGELLVEGLEEALEVRRGVAEPARRVRRVVTARQAAVRPPHRYGSRRIQRIRERLGLSQRVFAGILNASPETVRAWEQGKRQPEGMALALLEVADRHPEALLERIETTNVGTASSSC